MTTIRSVLPYVPHVISAATDGIDLVRAGSLKFTPESI